MEELFSSRDGPSSSAQLFKHPLWGTSLRGMRGFIAKPRFASDAIRQTDNRYPVISSRFY